MELAKLFEKAIPQEKDAAKIFTSEGIAPLITAIEKEARSFKGDISTPAGRKEVASAAHKVAKTKVAIDDMGKNLVADYKAKTSAIDAQRKLFRDRMDLLKEEVRAPLTEWEQTEESRKAELDGRLKLLADVAVFLQTPTSEAISARFQDANALYQFDWQGYQPLADEKYEAIKVFLDAMLKERQTYEAEQAELERLRKEAAARAVKDREDQIARDAAEKARIEAESKAETERRRVEEAAKLEAKKAEDARLEAEARAVKAEQDRLAAIEKADRDKKAAEEKVIADKKEAEEKAARLQLAAENDAAAARERARRAEEELKAANEKAGKEALERAKKAYDSYSGVIKEWARHHEIVVSEGMVFDLINRMMTSANNQKQKRAA